MSMRNAAAAHQRAPGSLADAPPHRSAKGAHLLERVPSRVLDNVERVIFIVALALFSLANLRARQGVGLLVVGNDGLTVFFLLFRRSTDQVSRSLYDWTVALLGTLGGMLMRPGGAPLIPMAAALVLILEGVALQLAAKLSLNRRFGLAPANRGVQDRWAYRLVRHPMYFGYLLMHTAYLLVNPTWLNIVAWTVTWVCQIARIFQEERFLLTDPAYRAYAKRVRFRLIPLVF